jgi:hypothetical protein
MNTKSWAAVAALFISISTPFSAQAELVRFIQVIKNETPDTRFHLGELEAFQNGSVPDDLGVAGSGLTTSTNDIGDGTLVTYGDGNLLPAIGTTTTLEHGGANKNPNNILENVGNVWSTATAQATNAQYTLDLGGTFDVTTVRMWPRNDTCCASRWQNLEVNLYADDAGNPGTLVASSDDARLTAPGGNVALELTFNPGSVEIEELVLTPRITFPTPADPVVLSSAPVGTVVGDLSALNEFGFPIEGVTYALVAGDGDTNNGSYDADGSELQATGDLSGLDNVAHSVRLEVASADGSLAAPITFTVVLDSDVDGLIDDWEEMFGVLGDFATGGDSDGDGVDDDQEFLLGLDPSDNDSDDDDSLDGAEITNGTDPLDDDSDDDGLLDGVETNTGEFLNAGSTGTDPLDADSDDDGLADNVEDNGGVFVNAEMTGTDPNNRDTDGDFRSDGAEVAGGLDPNVQNRPGEGIGLGLVNYWCFDNESLEDVAHSQSLGDSSVADDGVFAGANGTDGISFSAGLFNGGIMQDGAVLANNGFVEVVRSDDTLFGANVTNPAAPSTVTTSMWVEASGFDTNWQTMISHGEGAQYRIARRGGDVPEIAAYAGGSGDIPGAGIGPTIAAESGWHHIVGISEGGVSTRLWVDGELVETGAAPTIDDAKGGGALNLSIGANPDTGANNREWMGQIDDVAQWNRVLADAEITVIYNAGLADGSLKQLLGGGINQFRITNITYDSMGTPADRSDDVVSLTWPSTEGKIYGIYYTKNLDDWNNDLDDGYPADAGESTTFTFPVTRIADPGNVFFRIQN